MSRTIRKNKWGNKVRDGQRYSCRCSYCTGVDKRKQEAKVLKEEIEEAVDVFYS